MNIQERDAQVALVAEMVRALLDRDDVTVHKVIIKAAATGRVQGQPRDSGLEVVINPRDYETIEVEVDRRGGLLEGDAKRIQNQLTMLLMTVGQEVQRDIKEAGSAEPQGDF